MEDAAVERDFHPVDTRKDPGDLPVFDDPETELRVRHHDVGGACCHYVHDVLVFLKARDRAPGGRAADALSLDDETAAVQARVPLERNALAFDREHLVADTR